MAEAGDEVAAARALLLKMEAEGVGFVLDTVTRGRREMKLLSYLAQPPFGR